MHFEQVHVLDWLAAVQHISGEIHVMQKQLVQLP